MVIKEATNVWVNYDRDFPLVHCLGWSFVMTPVPKENGSWWRLASWEGPLFRLLSVFQESSCKLLNVDSFEGFSDSFQIKGLLYRYALLFFVMCSIVLGKTWNHIKEPNLTRECDSDDNNNNNNNNNNNTNTNNLSKRLLPPNKLLSNHPTQPNPEFPLCFKAPCVGATFFLQAFHTLPRAFAASYWAFVILDTSTGRPRRSRVTPVEG